MDSRLWVVLSDIHYPVHHVPSMLAVYDFLKRNASLIAGVVLLGDNMDCESISRHTEGLPGLRREAGLYEDCIGFDRTVMQPIEKLVPSAKKVIFMGNHEDWLNQMLDKMPELKKAVSFESLLHFDDRRWKVIPQGESYWIGKACLVHGDQIGSGMHVAKKAVESYCCTVIMGHVHTFAAYTKTSEVKKKDKWVGYTLPTLGTVAPKYGKGRPNSHLNGFGIIELWPNGNINVYVPVIVEGQFSFGGKIYGKKAE
jgi:UDP-2,3-diacylglucosamine pyrophosphatase LpxH